MRVSLLLTDEELDLSMREADIAIRLRQPQQPDLIQRRLFTVHFHIYASPSYVKRYGEPKSLEELDNHRILSFGGASPSYLLSVHWLGTAGRDPRNPRTPHLLVNNIAALRNAVEHGAGIARSCRTISSSRARRWCSCCASRRCRRSTATSSIRRR